MEKDILKAIKEKIKEISKKYVIVDVMGFFFVSDNGKEETWTNAAFSTSPRFFSTAKEAQEIVKGLKKKGKRKKRELWIYPICEAIELEYGANLTATLYLFNLKWEISLKKPFANVYYLSGGITNNPNYQAEFQLAEKEILSKLGGIVFNPAEQDFKNLSYSEIMKRDLFALLHCSHIVDFEPSYRSDGNAVELAVARIIGMDVMKKEETVC